MSDSERVNEEPLLAKLAKQPTEKSTINPTGKPKNLQSKTVVFATLFLVTGFLGIPLLWINQSFSNTERIVWSVVVTIYTVALLYGAWLICLWSYHSIIGA